ncbi:MAG: YqgE/AlgH family protein [Alphaproteobacteria bacterium]|nr:YqgE/AlgH family protein [Alphaproteobacteria bacterium]
MGKGVALRHGFRPLLGMDPATSYSPQPGFMLVAARPMADTLDKAVILLFHADADGCMGVRLDTLFLEAPLVSLKNRYPQLCKIPAGHVYRFGGPAFSGMKADQPCFVSVLASTQGLILPPDTPSTTLPGGVTFIGHNLKPGGGPPDDESAGLPGERVQFQHALFAIGLMAWNAGQLEQEIRDGLWKMVHTEPAFIFRLPPQQIFPFAAGLPAHVYYQA